MVNYGVSRARARILASRVLIARSRQIKATSAERVVACRVKLDRYWLELLADNSGRKERLAKC